jgi:hypothetical protein
MDEQYKKLYKQLGGEPEQKLLLEIWNEFQVRVIELYLQFRSLPVKLSSIGKTCMIFATIHMARVQRVCRTMSKILMTYAMLAKPIILCLPREQKINSNTLFPTTWTSFCFAPA